MNTYEITYFLKKSYSFETILIDSWSREEAIDIFCAKTGLNNGCIVNIDNLTEFYKSLTKRDNEYIKVRTKEEK